MECRVIDVVWENPKTREFQGNKYQEHRLQVADDAGHVFWVRVNKAPGFHFQPNQSLTLERKPKRDDDEWEDALGRTDSEGNLVVWVPYKHVTQSQVGGYQGGGDRGSGATHTASTGHSEARPEPLSIEDEMNLFWDYYDRLKFRLDDQGNTKKPTSLDDEKCAEIAQKFTVSRLIERSRR